tara:strand:+ start:1196 stop:1813 length:618 start_codon:yes stop_codon:yes gene_type:complete
MAKLGNFNIPEITLNKCIDVCRPINATKERSMSRLELSVLINMSARGGQFSKLINSCKSWGLIEGREFYNITDLAYKVFNPVNSNELIQSKKKLILNNHFFNALYKSFPNIEHNDTTLMQSIEEITGVDRFISLKYENSIRKILYEINPIAKSYSQGSMQPSSDKINETIKISSPGINVEFKFDDEGLNAAISLLNSLKVSKTVN